LELEGSAGGARALRLTNLRCSPPIKRGKGKEVSEGRGKDGDGDGDGDDEGSDSQISKKGGEGEEGATVVRTCFSARVGSGTLDKRVRS
jgi:hypothetical protein